MQQQKKKQRNTAGLSSVLYDKEEKMQLHGAAVGEDPDPCGVTSLPTNSGPLLDVG